MKKTYLLPEVTVTYLGEDDMITTSLQLYVDINGDAAADRGDVVSWS